jgi:hypothetical protein
MKFEFAYVIVTGLLIMIGWFYVSPFELNVDEDEDDE